VFGWEIVPTAAW